MKPSLQIFFKRLAWFILLTALFALVYNQAPLYTSNQNQYFLHGYAQADYGTLAEDWLANTADPTPVFSLLVAATLRVFHSPIPFLVYYAALMGVYLFSLFGILERFFPLRASRLVSVAFVALTFLLHSTLLRYLLMRLFAGDWAYLFEGGVAGQRLLGPVFQPSTFGVFLLFSLHLYLKDKKSLAILSAVLAATIHPTYLLSAAVLTFSYLVDTLRQEKQFWKAARLAALALAAVAPILVYTYVNFGGSDPVLAAEARQILVHIRIPNHAVVSEWFDATVVLKLLFLGLALFLLRRSRMFLILLIPAVVAIGLTILQVLTGSDMLALIFPWRLSTWLVPLSVGSIAAGLVTRLVSRIPLRRERAVETACIALVFLLAAAGVTRTVLEQAESDTMLSRPVQAYVASHRQAGEVYLVPSKMYDFRLEAGAPVYADFLSIPYRDEDVIAWNYRFGMANYFYQRVSCEKLEELKEVGVTHAVIPTDFPLECPQLVEVYRDSAYGLYELTP